MNWRKPKAAKDNEVYLALVRDMHGHWLLPFNVFYKQKSGFIRPDYAPDGKIEYITEITYPDVNS